MNYPELPTPYMDAHEDEGCYYPETYSASQMYEYVDQSIIKVTEEYNKELDKLTVYCNVLKVQLAKANVTIKQLMKEDE